jgi:hypothetical protein
MISTNIATQKQCLYVLQLHEYLIKTAISWFPDKVHFFFFFFFQVEQLLAGHEDSHGNINYEDFVRTVMNG